MHTHILIYIYILICIYIYIYVLSHLWMRYVTEVQESRKNEYTGTVHTHNLGRMLAKNEPLLASLIFTFCS